LQGHIAAPQALELDEAHMRQLVAEVMERLMAMLAELPAAPLHQPELADERYLQGLVEPVPESGAVFSDLLEHLFNECLPPSLNATSPGFMGYVPGGGLFHAAVADLLADTMNRYVGVNAVAGGFAQLEANVLRWFCEFMGLPQTAAGFLTSGGSLANWSAVVVAREQQLGEDFSRATVYTSDQAHHCVAKAVKLAGLGTASLRVIPCDSEYRLSMRHLREAVTADRAAGLRPFLLVASAGTTNTGAVDPLAACADFAAAEGLWLHVDAAYGGFFRLTGRGEQVLAGIERADSVALDPHKTLFLPYGTGALLVRQATHLKAAHASSADYLPAASEHQDIWDFADLSPELTRPYRGLRVWLPLKLHGVDVFREYLDEKLDLAQWLCAQLANIPQLEVIAPPQLSILAFAVRAAADEDVAARNRRTEALLHAINARQRVMLTGTMLKGLFVIRVAIVSFRTHQTRVEMLLEDLQLGLEALSL